MKKQSEIPETIVLDLETKTSILTGSGGISATGPDVSIEGFEDTEITW